MEQQIEKIVAAIEGMQPILEYLVAENAALASIVRALALSNVDNPAFQAAIKVEAETRNVGQLNSAMSDEGIDAFKKSLHSLLPQQLRDI